QPCNIQWRRPLRLLWSIIPCTNGITGSNFSPSSCSSSASIFLSAPSPFLLWLVNADFYWLDIGL
ncbi:hypothetical protein BGZ93_001332, partial [Podila epicladia]